METESSWILNEHVHFHQATVGIPNSIPKFDLWAQVLRSVSTANHLFPRLKIGAMFFSLNCLAVMTDCVLANFE